MNTIQVLDIGSGNTINYTEDEVRNYIRRAKEVDAVQQISSEYRAEAHSIRNKVRDFFSEREWSDRETTVNLDEVNELLNSIGSHAIQSTYSGNITISLSFCDLDADDADSAIAMIEDEIQVELYGASISVDAVNVDEITED
jgi:predicted RNA-binding Zn ribbon-like protein